MNPSEPRVQVAIDAALNQVRTTASSVADRTSETLGVVAQSALRIAERDLMIAAQFDLRRNMAQFQATFQRTLADKVRQELGMQPTARRSLAETDWQSLSLVEDREVEERMFFDRIAQMIAHECEAELRELATYMGALLRIGRADEERDPLRPEVLGMALYRAIETVSDQGEIRKLLAREMGQAMARAMPACYTAIIRDFQGRGIQPVGLAVRTFEGPGHQLPGVNSAYATLPKGEYQSSRGQMADADGHSGAGSFAASGMGHGRVWNRGAATGPAPLGQAPFDAGATGMGPAGRGGAGSGDRAGLAARTSAAAMQADAQLMNLLRRLTVLASQPGEFDVAARLSGRGNVPAGTRSTSSGSMHLRHTAAGPDYSEDLTGLMAVNLIRAHREELMQASTGKLDHMVIDVVGSLFDQILSDSRVPPQMARQIARLQLPVLRVALNDSTFFSSRRHPVRRFVNRIASLAVAFEDFNEGPGKQLLDRVRELVQEIVDGDFDQVDLYIAKLAELEGFIAEQTHGEAQQAGAASTLDTKESELRLQQRYMLQLQAALGPLSLAPYLREFLSQVWSQALVLAVRRDGADSERATRYRRAGRDLVMSVQPKGSPALRKKFLMQLPPLMKDLNEGMQLVGWPAAAQKAFFAKLLPAHAESLKGQPLSDLDHNMMVRQLENVFATPVPGIDTLSAADPVPEVDQTVIEARFTPEEAQRVGLVEQAAVDWDGSVDIELDAAAEATEATTGPGEIAEPGGEESDAAPLDLGLDINLDAQPAEPTRGPQLFDHVKLGVAYQMHLKDEWQKVRLTYVSPGRSFFVFSRGKKHQETISMTSRMLARMCETGRMRAVESSYLMERATQRARKQLAALKAPSRV
jgi:hypothetical protein